MEETREFVLKEKHLQVVQFTQDLLCHDRDQPPAHNTQAKKEKRPGCFVGLVELSQC